MKGYSMRPLVKRLMDAGLALYLIMLLSCLLDNPTNMTKLVFALIAGTCLALAQWWDDIVLRIELLKLRYQNAEDPSIIDLIEVELTSLSLRQHDVMNLLRTIHAAENMKMTDISACDHALLCPLIDAGFILATGPIADRELMLTAKGVKVIQYMKD